MNLRPARGFVRRGRGIVVLALGASLAGCVQPDPAPLDRVALLEEVRGRDAVASPTDDVSAAIDRHPEVRAALRRLIEARARAASAGSPGPIEVSLARHDLETGDAPFELVGGIDLLGILGLEPVRAERELARAEVEVARAELVATRRMARFEIERALVELAAARTRAARLRQLAKEAGEGERRVASLARAGRVGDAPSGRAVAMAATVRERALAADAEARALAAELARVSGLGPASTALSAPGPALLAERAQAASPRAAADEGHAPANESRSPDEPTLETLYDLHPLLRRDRLRHGLAEARLAREAARTWPGVRLASRLEIGSDDVVPGGLLGFSIPFPGSFEGEIAAADAARETERQMLIDDLIALWNRARSAFDRRRIHADRLAGDVGLRDRASARAWRGARARLAVEERAADMWSDALMNRAEAIVALTETEAALVLASLDLEETSGPFEEESR